PGREEPTSDAGPGTRDGDPDEDRSGSDGQEEGRVERGRKGDREEPGGRERTEGGKGRVEDRPQGKAGLTPSRRDPDQSLHLAHVHGEERLHEVGRIARSSALKHRRSRREEGRTDPDRD